ncbi:hypothetical protein C7T35_39490 [Variovorax sp. WS11]|uniref:SDR family NAD(P)-dependent oxidoreductase n=1 Tax=Variovorax sp. WS11 TaxID=1105204 RepID=UPI000D0D67E0|nr:SDR family NAD(P)-dependent oxidoreductase [Variovorax sp. WS11]PSL79081.1 hypothetical protein C7T35_39490 [Variovorax sp. WS11]
MKRIFITGSSDGLGARVGQLLIAAGFEVVLHARSEQRAADAMHKVPGASAALVADVSTLRGCYRLAELANSHGTFDAVIHNVAVFHREDQGLTEDGCTSTFTTNSLAPYVLTAAMQRPARLVYLSSDMHIGGRLDFDDLGWARRPWDGTQAYSDTKLHDAMLAFAMARR